MKAAPSVLPDARLGYGPTAAQTEFSCVGHRNTGVCYHEVR